MKSLKHLAFILLPLGIPLIAAAGDQWGSNDRSNDRDQHAFSPRREFSPLVEKVRRATARFKDINVATSEGWAPGTPCVSGPNSGAMGVHFVLGERLKDAVVNADEPEALIYEPLPDGAVRLVGVEFILLAPNWEEAHPEGGAPQLDGHLMNYVGAPNRYGLPAFYELHVWAWEHNPNGSFADWNTLVSCDKQQPPPPAP